MRDVVIHPPRVNGQVVTFSWSVDPPAGLYRRQQFEMGFPPSVSPAAIPAALWSYVAVICLHAHWPLLRPCRVTLPHAAPPGEIEVWLRLLDAECWTLDAFRHDYASVRAIALAPGDVPATPQPLGPSERCATAFSSGRDSLVQTGLLCELTRRPLLVTVTSPMPGSQDHTSVRRRWALDTIGLRRAVEQVEVTSDYRATFDNLAVYERTAFPVAVSEVSDVFLYFAALLVVAWSRGIGRLFVAGEADIQVNEMVAGRLVQYYQYMYTLPTQRALGAILAPFGVSYASLVAPLHHQDALALLTGRYADLADLQTSCWRMSKGQVACSACNNCFDATIARVSKGLDPADLGIDVAKLFAHEESWSSPSDGWAADLLTTRADLRMDAGIYAALEALSTRRILAASRAAGVAERVRVAGGIRRRRKRGLALGVQAARGFAPSFLPYTDPALHIRLGAIFTASLRADPRDDGSADRGDALYRWITAPLRGKYT